MRFLLDLLKLSLPGSSAAMYIVAGQIFGAVQYGSTRHHRPSGAVKSVRCSSGGSKAGCRGLAPSSLPSTSGSRTFKSPHPTGPGRSIRGQAHFQPKQIH
ncbi:hypothetical protein GE21DRAFT_1282169 [Neurospora crassa]|nr:hypothetical protein GE21DRAFT_1282169 [Neurospora crassa]